MQLEGGVKTVVRGAMARVWVVPLLRMVVGVAAMVSAWRSYFV